MLTIVLLALFVTGFVTFACAMLSKMAAGLGARTAGDMRRQKVLIVSIEQPIVLMAFLLLTALLIGYGVLVGVGLNELSSSDTNAVIAVVLVTAGASGFVPLILHAQRRARKLLAEKSP